MLSKSQISFINSLKQKKHREEHQLFIAEGAKIVSELLNSAIVVKQVYATSEFLRITKIPNTVERFEIKENELERISSLTKANEVLAVCEVPKYELENESLKGKLTLVLDDIKDPGLTPLIQRLFSRRWALLQELKFITFPWRSLLKDKVQSSKFLYMVLCWKAKIFTQKNCLLKALL
ncbi:MAG: RNA methyltransferase [Gammaproteobacteria bacterium]|nr:RNA methyltransferase [Gammaproteobacteria bacterium]